MFNSWKMSRMIKKMTEEASQAKSQIWTSKSLKLKAKSKDLSLNQTE